jgi:hypothetical protein
VIDKTGYKKYLRLEILRRQALVMHQKEIILLEVKTLTHPAFWSGNILKLFIAGRFNPKKTLKVLLLRIVKKAKDLFDF